MKALKMAAVVLIACGVLFSTDRSAFAIERSVSFVVPTLST
jgi:hypothetical protein